MIFVTQPSLAPLEEYTQLLAGVWERGILTHNGPLVQQLERDLCSKLEIDSFVAVSNGTIALQMAIKALGLSGSGGEIITTPFTWVATLSAIQWDGCTPVFCEIQADTFNIDPAKIEACITEHTVAIMPVHVFGNPCDVDAIATIARSHGLKVIYDAAHAIGSTYKGRSVLDYGDISATSLHATKILNAGEGGGCVTRDQELHAKLKRIRFFGHDDDKDIVEEGLNGKMTEVHAALGLANLKYYDEVLADRKSKYLLYKELLADTPELTFQALEIGEANCSYFPLVFESEAHVLAAERRLLDNEIMPRRYFYPAANTLKAIVANAPVMVIAENIASRVLCLPLYWSLGRAEIQKISRCIAAIPADSR